MIKYSSCDILDIFSPKTQKDAKKLASKNDFKFERFPGYTYVALRAISSRCNQNGDMFGPDELSKSWKTYYGAPHHLEHKNQNWRDARGCVVEVKYHPDDAPKELLADQENNWKSRQRYNEGIWTPKEHLNVYATNNDSLIVNHHKDHWIELLVEIDTQSFPLYGKALENGTVNSFSMGTDVQESLCAICGMRAKTEFDYCEHVRNYKNQWIEKQGYTIHVAEENIGLEFFEISAVRDPADPSALLIDMDFALDNKELALAQVASKKLISFLYHHNVQNDAVYDLSEELKNKEFDFAKVASIVAKINKEIK